MCCTDFCYIDPVPICSASCTFYKVFGRARRETKIFKKSRVTFRFRVILTWSSSLTSFLMF